MFILEEKNIQLIKLSLVFPAGRWNEDFKTQSFLMAKMLKTGTTKYTALEIEKKLDFLGASIDVEPSMDNLNITLYSTKKNFFTAFELLIHCVTEAVFTDSEWEHLILVRIEKLKQVLSKNDDVADRALGEAIFGANHPYGYAASEADYKSISKTACVDFYQNQILQTKPNVYLAGDISEEIIKHIQEEIALAFPNQKQEIISEKNIQPAAEKKQRKQNMQPHQNAIRIGWESISVRDNAFFEIQILNTVLGGYFSSRLMNVLREDKGYTYGAYSYITPLKQHSYITIGTEVDISYTEETVDVIHQEMLQLKTKKISEKELNSVKQYLLGDILREQDGSFKKLDAQMKIDRLQVPHYYTAYSNKIKQITAKDILEAANKTFIFENMYTIIV